ncbi:Ig-like domain (group 2) [Plakobranchus ocellatus]|uniref:Ig-like domain (Group 2) n=1 Tax=Plakobranchus ocellatus TaxID=259542 RepID=A0AAV4CLB7_9GAST|nr:Ig-like domain (group 2) [Plakobranchus ocellatus]
MIGLRESEPNETELEETEPGMIDLGETEPGIIDSGETEPGMIDSGLLWVQIFNTSYLRISCRVVSHSSPISCLIVIGDTNYRGFVELC